MFFPASLKQNEGFIYADNPDRGENIKWLLLRNEFTQLQGPKKRNKSASFRQRVLKGH